MANVIIASFFIGVFVLAIALVLTLAIRGAIHRHRHPRTKLERWADEHGDQTEDFKLSGGPSWTGTSGGGGVGG